MLSDQKGSDNIQVCSSLAAAVSGNVNRLVEHNVTTRAQFIVHTMLGLSA